MDTTTIDAYWAPIYNELVKGVRQLTPEYANLKQLRSFGRLSPRSINWAIELVNGGGMAWTGDGESTARATSNEPPEATDTWSYLTGRFEVSFDPLVDGGPGGSKSNAAKLGSGQLANQVADKLRSFRRAIATGFYGYPDAILLHATGANISNPTGSQTAFGVDSLYGGGPDLTGALPAGFRIRDYVTANKDTLAVHVAETGTERGAGQIIAGGIDEAGDVITVDSGTYFGGAIAANDAVVLKNQVLAGATSDLNKGINGLLHLTRSASVHGVPSLNYDDWTAGVDESAYNAALGGADLYEFFETISQRSDHDVQWGYTTVGVIAAAGGAELDQRRYGSDDDTMRLGFKKLNVMGVMVEGRPYVPSGHLFMGSNTALKKIAPDEDVKDVVTNGDRSGSFKQYPDRLGFYRDQIMRTQIVAVSRLGLGVVSGITEN